MTESDGNEIIVVQFYFYATKNHQQQQQNKAKSQSQFLSHTSGKRGTKQHKNIKK